MEQKSLVLRFSVIFGAIIVLGLIIYLNKKDDTSDQSNRNGSALSVSEVDDFDPNAFQRDTDGDGLRDWEESLWGTDLNNPDTDGDGTSDSAEVTAGRDPLIAGPNDQVEVATVPSYSRTDVENLTTTEAFEKDFYEGLEQLSADGQLNNETLQTFILGLTREYVAKEQVDVVYTESDISISSDPSLTFAKDYANRLGVAAAEYREVDLEQELDGIQAFIESQNPATTSSLDAVIANYSTAHTAMLNVGTVPYVFSSSHLKILNGLAFIEKALSELQEYTATDPLKGMIKLSLYQMGVVLITQGDLEIAELLRERNITFAPSEPGSILLND